MYKRGGGVGVSGEGVVWVDFGAIEKGGGGARAIAKVGRKGGDMIKI